jgi:hypothetical protein
MKIENQEGDWIYINPIKGIEMSDQIGSELTIQRVTFISSRKLKYVAKRFNLPTRKEINKNPLFKEFFENNKTFGILRFKGKPSDKKVDSSKIIENELNILLSSILGWRTRKYAAGISLVSSSVKNFKTDIYLKKGEFSGSINNSVTTDPRPLILDKNWKKYHDYFFFTRLLKIIKQKTGIPSNWRNTLTRAASMIGQSHNSNDMAFCFLWNMIVIEMLLTEQGDKYSEKLPERIESFLGWAGYWNDDNYAEKIKELYQKRCAFVHDGNRKTVTAKDLLFSDDLVFNLMHNIVKHISIFSSKQKLIEYSDKVKAEKLLGIKSKVQPKSLQIISKNYSEEDFVQIDKNFA